MSGIRNFCTFLDLFYSYHRLHYYKILSIPLPSSLHNIGTSSYELDIHKVQLKALNLRMRNDMTFPLVKCSNVIILSRRPTTVSVERCE